MRGSSVERFVEIFKKKYGDKEVKLPVHIMTIRDDYPCAFCSGDNGYLTKVRIKNGKFEFYHDWWAYGWLSISDIESKYPDTISQLESVISNLLSYK